MKSYLSLIPISAKVHKRKNRMTLFCIILAVLLVTGVFSMEDAGVEGEKRLTLSTKGRWHIYIDELSEDNADRIAARSDIAAVSWYQSTNLIRSEKGFGTILDAYTIQGNPTALYGIEEPFIKEMMTYFDKTATLAQANQIILSANAKELLKVDVGAEIVLQTPAGSCEFLVSGFLEEEREKDAENNNGIRLKDEELCAFIRIDAFRQICELGKEQNIYSAYYLQFSKHANVRRALAEIKKEYPMQEEYIHQNDILMMSMGLGDSSYMANIYGMAVFLFILILLAGIFMISSSLNSNIAERAQFFGMMRCIGASKRQMIRFVRLEALMWCKTAIPVGIALGTFFTWLLCAAIKYLIGGEFAQMPVIRVSLIGTASGVIVGLLTVLLAAQSPAKKAAKVSPVSAVSGSQEGTKKMHHAAYIRHLKIETALGIHHAVAAKKNLLLMTCSFALSIMMFLCFSVLLDFFSMLLPDKSYASDISVISVDYDNTIDKEWMQRLREIPYVKEVFGRTSVGKVPASFNKETTQNTVDLISYSELQLQWLVKDGDVRRGSDIKKVYGDSRYVLGIYDKTNPLDIGDHIWINGEEVEIAGMLKNNPFTNDGSSEGIIDIICSEETCVRLTGEENYSIVDLQVEKEITEAEVKQIKALGKEQGYEVLDRREEGDRSIFWAFTLLVYGFLLIIAMISVLNIVNSISMSVSARIKQYGAMRAVGMNGKQLRRMIAAEAYTYAFFGCSFGCFLGLPLSKMMHDFLITSHFGESFAWTFPVWEILIIFLLVFLSVIAAVYLPSKRICEMEVTETINEL